jgi:hypothetical protein
MLGRAEQAFLQRIQLATSGCVGATLVRFPAGVSVKASSPGGFDMTVMIEGGKYTLYFDNWIEEFVSSEAARRTFEAALSGEARLRVDTLSGRRWRWTLERLDDAGRWVPESSVAHVIWRFWGHRTTVHLRNSFRRQQPSDGASRAPLAI